MLGPIRIVAVLYCLLCCCPAWAESVEGVALRDVLEDYRASGINLIYSSAAVKRGMRVDVQSAPQSLDELRKLLQQHNLGLQPASGDSWYVVELASRPAPAIRNDVEQKAADGSVQEMIVVSSRYRLVKDMHDTRQLDGHEIAGIPSMGRDLLRAVSTLPGQASNGVSARQRIRGGGEEEVLYLLDGAKIIDPFHLKDFQSLFSAVNPNIVDAVDVYSNGFPSRFGNYLSGVVDLHLSAPRKPIGGSVDLNLLGLSTHAQGYAGDWEWLASARRGTLDWLLSALDRDYGRPRYHDELLRAQKSTERDTLVIGFAAFTDEITLRDPSAGEEGSSRYENNLGWLSWEHDFAKTMTLGLRADVSLVRNDRAGRLDNPVDAVGSLEESRDFDVFHFAADWRQALGDHTTLHAGLEYELQDGDFAAELETVYGALGAALQPVPGQDREISTKRDGTMTAGHLTLRREFGENLGLALGVRYDLQDIDPVHDNQVSPRLQINYTPRSWLKLFANVGRYTQHQNLYELELDDGLVELSEPQLSDQLSFGMRIEPSARWQVQVDLYNKQIDDPQLRFDNLYNRYALLPELHADRVAVQASKARAKGIELLARGRVDEELAWQLQYVRSDVEEKIAGVWRPRPWRQKHSIRLGVDWQHERWRIAASGGFHSGWPTTSVKTMPLASARELYDRNLKDFLSLDLLASYRWQMANSDLELYLDVSNLSNRKNIGGYTFEQDEGGIDRDPRDLLPLVPTLGINWRW